MSKPNIITWKQSGYKPPPDTLVQHPKAIVIHHTAGNEKVVNDIPPSYHIAVFPDGTAYQIFQVEHRGWHTAGFNKDSIGISVVGNYEVNPTIEIQLYSAMQVAAWYCAVYNIPIKNVYHHQLVGTSLPKTCSNYGTACPGKNVIKQWPDMKRVINSLTYRYKEELKEMRK